MDIFGIGAATTAGASIATTAMGIEAAKEQQKREQAFNAEQALLNREWQSAEREAQNQWNLDQWNRNNEYNSLASQIERALAAGVNPNAVIGNGAGVASSPAQGANIGSGAQASTSSIAGDLLEAYSNVGPRTAESLMGVANSVGTNIDNRTRDWLNRKKGEQIDANVNQMVKDGLLKEEEAKLIKKNRSWIDRINNATMEKIYTECSELLSQMHLNYQNARVADAKVDEIKASTDLMEEQKVTEQKKQDVLGQEFIKEKFFNYFRKQTGLDPNTTILPAAVALAKMRQNDTGADPSDEEILEACAIMCSPQIVSGTMSFFNWLPNFLKGNKQKGKGPQEPQYVVLNPAQ